MYEIKVYMVDKENKSHDLILHVHYDRQNLPFDTNGLTEPQVLQRVIALVEEWIVMEQINGVGECVITGFLTTYFIPEQTKLDRFKKYFIPKGDDKNGNK